MVSCFCSQSISLLTLLQGKRKKSARKPVTTKKVWTDPCAPCPPSSTNGYKKEALPTVFQCLFCNHEKSVTVKLDRKQGIGSLSCKVCGQTHQTNITFLDQAVDVYASWVDACEAVKHGPQGDEEGIGASEHRPSYRGTARETKPVDAIGGEEGYADEGEDFVVDDEMDAEADYDDHDE
jgi:transcription elongation factor Elf1